MFISAKSKMNNPRECRGRTQPSGGQKSGVCNQSGAQGADVSDNVNNLKYRTYIFLNFNMCLNTCMHLFLDRQ